MTRLCGIIVLLLACLGCENAQPEHIRLRKELDLAEQRIEDLTRKVEQQTARIDAQAEQIETLQQLGETRVEKCFAVESLEIGRHSGGIDTDKQPGHDAVVVYLKPRDAQGATIKAAGSIRIQLFDLAADEGDRLVGQWAWDVDRAREHYASGMLANHYSFELPLKPRPAHPDLTIRAEFTDYLTGRTFDASKAFTVTLPPAAMDE
ncbi:MAG: hypothetical protein GVY16_04275 [Planctomycetes bacterium]|nr:hypothetical protein [Phycisphaerae bacterium]NBB94937.1 hypothetical protein [Planctomycetota bacterium]